ncbi:Piso0_004906 [Millerozyma farinosa CBS 7064]|uniref:Peroxisomal ATPase PEX1 n=1 Tax=Pichia sorbitophila (strain ATCC MYA-4447 / BCRC 22081 / CBS 7064 / NBRC 10061 / NRRL Y-12695) TaxID=559304 RepID=G8Y0R5_PICSO|nr:Piso0_004906 [Millerozyma farinosa CBS 7064]
MDNHRVGIAFKSLRTNLINLPSHLSGLLYNANVSVQDVVIEVVCQNKSKVYCGWTGMTSNNARGIEIDPIAAHALTLSENQQVTINLKIKNFETKQVNLEPLTSSDWELVEIHAQTLEDKLLSQCRCVSLNQVLVVFPSQTTSARLLVTDIGTKEHTYAKLSPLCEVAVAPKVREKKPSTSSTKSKSMSSKSDDYSKLPTILRRGISLPHALYNDLPPESNNDGYEVYANAEDIYSFLGEVSRVSVSTIPGPNSKVNVIGNAGTQENDSNSNISKDNKGTQKQKGSSIMKENRRIVANFVNFPRSPNGTVGISKKLAIALGIEYEVGNIICLKPPVKPLPKKQQTLVVYPYMTQTKKNNSVNINSKEKKEKDTKNLAMVAGIFAKNGNAIKTPITNFMKIPIIQGVLPKGGLLKFKKNDDTFAWFDLRGDINSSIKLEYGEELLRGESFIETAEKRDRLQPQVGMQQHIDGIIDNLTSSRNSGVLVYGNSGSGKTLLLEHVEEKIKSMYGYHTKYIKCESLMNENYTSLSNTHITSWLQECAWHKPSLLILDNLDKILSAEVEHVDNTLSAQLTDFLISRLQRIHIQHMSNLSILVSGISKEAFNKLLLSSHVVENFVHLSSPDKFTRHELIRSYFEDELNSSVKFDIADVVAETEGYLPNDLKVLCDRIFHNALFSKAGESFDKVEPSQEDFSKAIQGYTPSNLRGVKLQKSSISWSDIGGLQDTKRILLETLEWPTKYAPIFSSCPLRLRSGILLYGYPGCGKTLLASAVAAQCGLNFISIKGPEILNKYIGASEQSVRELFERAQAAKPCILFFDEFDSIAPKRGHDSTGVTDRVVNQMLTQMDGAEGLDGVYVLAATSRPDLIDSALLRPGRLDKSLICDMPSFEDRLDILRSVTDKMNLESDVDLAEVSRNSEGFSGADIQGLAYNAYLKAVHRKLDEETEVLQDSNYQKDNTLEYLQISSEKLKKASTKPSEKLQTMKQIEQVMKQNAPQKKRGSSSTSADVSSSVCISHSDLVSSLKDTKPSISVTEKAKLQKIYREFVSDRDGNMPDGTPSSEIGGRTSLM